MSRGVRGIVAVAALLALAGWFAIRAIAALAPAGPPPPPPPPAVASGVTAPPRIEVAAAVPLEDLDAALARPPFAEDRRPPEGPAPAPAPVEEAAPDVVLAGVIFSDDQQVAILEERDGGESVRLRAGDLYRGWTVEEVSADAVTITRGGRTARIVLEFTRRNVGPAVVAPERERPRRRLR